MSQTKSDGEAQERVRRVIADAVREDPEEAVQVAAWRGGRLIVDAWSAGAAVARPVDGETLFPVYSTSKGIAATAIHRLVDRGTLTVDAPIARWWPEFAAHGKAAVTLRHVLAHVAGLQALPEHGDMAGLCDWERMCAFFADAAPCTPPGERRAYHAISYGWLIGETARRADGRAFPRIVDEEVRRPLGLDGLFIGLPDAQAGRVIDVLPPRTPPPPPTAIEPAVPPWVLPLETWMNRADTRRACMPASNGMATARAVAAHYAALLTPGFLSEATLRDATTLVVPAVADPDAPRFGLGYALWGPPEDPAAVFGHGGYGGSTGFADRRLGLAVGVTRRRMDGGGLADAISAAIRETAAG